MLTKSPEFVAIKNIKKIVTQIIKVNWNNKLYYLFKTNI